jgi:hypothetical protein
VRMLGRVQMYSCGRDRAVLFLVGVAERPEGVEGVEGVGLLVGSVSCPRHSHHVRAVRDEKGFELFRVLNMGTTGGALVVGHVPVEREPKNERGSRAQRWSHVTWDGG